MRSWGVLSEWLTRNGFPATQPGHHIVARAQRRSFSRQVQGRRKSGSVGIRIRDIDIERRSPASQRDVNREAYEPHSTAIPAAVPRESWEQMDQTNLEEALLRRVPMSKSVPHFLRGRRSLSVALLERCRAKLVGQDWRIASVESVRSS